MNEPGSLSSILELCIYVDKTAAEIYARLAASAKTDALKRFWENMAEQASLHLDYWQNLYTHAGKEELSQIFDDPQRVYQELFTRARQINKLTETGAADLSLGETFALAYRLEALKLHPAFRTLLQHFYPLLGNSPEQEEQESAVKRFREAINKSGAVTPELELIGETLENLWEQNKILSRLATIDRLTTLLNRRGFFIMARQAVFLAKRNHTPVAVLVADINNLSAINAQFGNNRGDEIIKVVAGQFQSRLRGSDLLARFSGDEFIALLPDTDQQGAVIAANKLQEDLAGIRPGGLEITVRVGIADGYIMGDVERELGALIRRAENQLYLAGRKARPPAPS